MIKIPYRISREFIQAHPELIFVYGSDLHNCSRVGQVGHCLGEPNAFSIPTKIKLCRSNTESFVTDAKFDSWFKDEIDKRFNLIPRDGRLIIPLRKIGEGCAELQTRAPRTLAYIQSRLKEISASFEIDWYA